MKPNVKRFRELEDDPDVGAMVADLELPPEPEVTPEYGLDLTDVKATPGVPPVVASPSLPEYDDTADRAAIAKGAAADKQTELLRMIESGGRQFTSQLLGQPLAQTLTQSTNEEAKATSAADKRKAEAKQRRIEALRALEIGEATNRATSSQAAADARAKAAQAAEDAREAARQAYDAEQRRLDRKSRETVAQAIGARAEAGAKAKGEERVVKANEGLPYGYEQMEGATNSKKQREDGAEIIIQRDQMAPLIGELETLSKDRMAFTNPATRKRIAQIREQLGSKIRVMENLGVPSGKDMDIQLNIIGDPNNAANNVFDVMPALLKGLRSYANNNVDAKLKVYGIRKKAEPSGRVTVRKGDDVREIDADDLSDARADGYEVAQ